MSGRLAGKACLVTAAGQGIGRATAEAFAAEGGRVLATDINALALGTLGGMETLTLDVTDAAAVAALFAARPAFDVVFNCAGWVHAGSILDCSEDDWARALALNVTAMYRVCKAALPGMVAAGGGSIVNMASVASSIKGVPDRFAYGATKAAVIGLTKSIAADFVGAGVRCNAIAPGTVATPSLRERMAALGGDIAAVEAAFKARQPMGRLGTADEIAALAVYLASDESGFTTGAVHVIDRGVDGVNPVLVELTRGRLVESRHRGAIAVADASGRLVWSVGDVKRRVYPRSALKMLQALPLIESGAAEAYGVTDRELALACASHSGEPFHVETVAAWLHRIGCTEADLACGAPAGLTRLHHNCSGKHTGFLTVARHIGAPTQGYEQPDHPVQRLALAGMAEMAGVERAAMPVAIDGCTAPAAAMTLAALATAEARLADDAGLPKARAAAVRRLDAAVKAEPLYVAGTGRACTALIQAAHGAASVKTGAEGAYVAVLSRRRLGVALKIDDGAGRASETAIAAVLAALGAVDAADPAIAALIRAPVTNSAGRVVGQRHPSAGLERALARLRLP